MAIDKATTVALGGGLGLRGSGAGTRGLAEATTNDGGRTLGIGARQGGRGKVGVGEMVEGDHGGIEDAGRDVGGNGGKGVEGVGRAGAAAAVAGDVEELFRRCTACRAVALGRRGQNRGGDRLRVKLWNLGRDVQRVEGEVARACSKSKAIRARCQYLSSLWERSALQAAAAVAAAVAAAASYQHACMQAGKKQAKWATNQRTNLSISASEYWANSCGKKSNSCFSIWVASIGF